MRLFKAVLLGDSPRLWQAGGSLSSGWPRLPEPWPRGKCVHKSMAEGLDRKSCCREMRQGAAGRGVASAHAGSTHEHTQTGRSAFSPQFLSSGCPALQKPRHRSVRGPTRVNALFTSCLLASNFHLSDWPAQLEHRPQAAAGRERLYCLVLYLSLAGLEKCCPSLRRQQPTLQKKKKKNRALASLRDIGWIRSHTGWQTYDPMRGSCLESLGRFQVRWRLLKMAGATRARAAAAAAASPLLRTRSRGLGFITGSRDACCRNRLGQIGIFHLG